MIKKIIVSISLLFSLVSFAQSGSSSPYSFYGIGDVRFRGTVENRSMAGLSILPDSIHINLDNPAMYSSLKLTSFSVGGTFGTTKLLTNAQDDKAQRTTLDYLAIGIPSKKLGIGFGLIPYSSVGYNIRNTSANGIDITRYTGTGGINKAYLGFGYQLNTHFSFGADVQYNFGKIETKTIYDIGVQYSTRELNRSDASGVTINTGIAYHNKISKDLMFYSSATFSPESTLYLNNSRSIATVQYIDGAGEIVYDSSTDVSVANSKLKLPSKFTFGAGIGNSKKWLVGAQLTLQNFKNFSNRFADINNVSYENATRFTVGGYYIPNYKSFNNYFSKVVYRGGFRFENTGLVINNKPIEDAALTLGLGMPLRGTFSNINLGFELGNKGTKDAGLVREHYMNFSIGLSLNDEWFRKRKYD